jgi:hypothetical protein
MAPEQPNVGSLAGSLPGRSLSVRRQPVCGVLLSPNPVVRRLLFGLAVLSLLALAWIGFSGGWSQLSEAHTLGQKTQTVCQFAYGLFALLSVVTTFRGHRWSPVSYAGWTVSITLAGGLAPVVWGDASVAIGLLSGLATLLVALALIGLLRSGARGLRGA